MFRFICVSVCVHVLKEYMLSDVNLTNKIKVPVKVIHVNIAYSRYLWVE